MSYIHYPKTLDKYYFYDTNINLNMQINILHCNQDIKWEEIQQNRDKLLKQRLTHTNSHRQNPISSEEKEYKKSILPKQNDIFLDFSKFYTDIRTYVPHFQLRRALKTINDSNLIYFTPSSLEQYNIHTNKSNSILVFTTIEEDNIGLNNYTFPMCFDATSIYTNSILVAFGNTKGKVFVYRIDNLDLKYEHRNITKEIKQVSSEDELINDLEVY